MGEFAPVRNGNHAGGVATDAEDGVVAHELASRGVFGADGKDAGAVALAELHKIAPVQRWQFDLEVQASLISRELLHQLIHRDDGGQRIGASIPAAGSTLDVEKFTVDLPELELFVGIRIGVADGFLKQSEFAVPDVEVEKRGGAASAGGFGVVALIFGKKVAPGID